MSDSSRVAAAGETAARSQMEQSVDVGGALLQLVLSGRLIEGDGDSRFDRWCRLLEIRYRRSSKRRVH